MSTLDKLRFLHREVCHCWRLQSPRPISEGEAELLNLGFLVLEKLVEADNMARDSSSELVKTRIGCLRDYFNRVHSQLYPDADTKITGM